MTGFATACVQREWKLPQRGKFRKYQGGGWVIAPSGLSALSASFRQPREQGNAMYEMSQKIPCSSRQETFTQRTLSGWNRQVIGAAKSGGAWRSFLVLQG